MPLYLSPRVFTSQTQGMATLGSLQGTGFSLFITYTYAMTSPTRLSVAAFKATPNFFKSHSRNREC